MYIKICDGIEPWWVDAVCVFLLIALSMFVWKTLHPPAWERARSG